MTSPDESTSPTPMGRPMELNGHILEPESQMLGGHMFQESASSCNYVIIQFAELPTVDQEKQLRDRKVQFCQVIPPSSWLARLGPYDLSPVRDLPFVVYANPYHECLSLNPTWLAKLQETTRRRSLLGTGSSPLTSCGDYDRQMVVIMLHMRARSPSEMREYLITNHGIDQDRVFIDIMALRASLSAEEIIRISHLDQVSSIHPEQQDKLGNHLMREIIHTTVAGETQNRNLGMDKELDGDEEIIVIADSGLDKGSTADLHPFFRPSQILHLDARSEHQGTDANGQPISRKDKVDDWDGHGTHIAGTALGLYDGLAFQPEMRAYSPRLYGVAPKAGLVMQAITGCPSWDALGKVKRGAVKLTPGPLAFPTVFLDPYHGYPSSYSGTAGGLSPAPSGKAKFPWRARIHSNSYGPSPDPTAYGYRPGGFQLDCLLYKARDYLVIFGAGNDGDRKTILSNFADGQITSYCAAKNALIVGACFNNQYVSLQDGLYSRYLSSYAGGSVVEPNCIPRFSSRGPTANLNPRVPGAHASIIKPDIVAPGVAIYSAKSRSLAKGIDKLAYGFAPKPDDNCQFLSGTSMAAPVVAGAAALLRQALRRRAHSNPSAALLKALIVNGAVDLFKDAFSSKRRGQLWKGDSFPSSDFLYRAPDEAQGWGRIDIADSVDIATNSNMCGFRDVTYDGTLSPKPRDGRLKPDLDPPDEHRIAIRIGPPPVIDGHPSRVANLKATLAWTDLPGEGLQNQLSLSIKFVHSDWQSQDVAVDVAGTGDSSQLIMMARNNVQKLLVPNIDIEQGQVAEVRIIVRAERIVEDPDTHQKEPQDYAICWKVWYSDSIS